MYCRFLGLALLMVVGLQGCSQPAPHKRFGANLSALTKSGSDYNPIGMSANRTVVLLERQITYPPANWYRQNDLRNMYGQSEHVQRGVGHREILVEVPKGDDLKKPSQIFVVDVLLHPAQFEESERVEEFLTGIKNACRIPPVIEESFSYENVYVVKCPQYSRPDSKQAQEPEARISVFRLVPADGVLVMVSHSWFGPAFDFDGEDDWIVSPSEIQAVASALQGIQVVDPQTGKRYRG